MKNATSQDSEDIFLSNVLKEYMFWKNRVSKMQADGRDATKELLYAEAYRLLLHQFSYVEPKKEE